MEFITDEVDFYTIYSTYICEYEMSNFSRSYFDQLEMKNSKMFVNTEISLT